MILKNVIKKPLYFALISSITFCISSTNLYAFSFDDIKNKVSSFLNQKDTKDYNKKNFGSVYAEYIYNYDGDTIRVNIKNYPPIIGKNMPIRINAIDTPEIRGKCNKEKELAKKAKYFVKDLLTKNKTIELRNMQRGKYFRIASDIYVNGNNLGNLLIQKGYAIKYDGGKKTKDWCK